jgi:hypothetical protein
MTATPYLANKPNRTESSDELRARIPGWGADLDPNDRPAVPREQFDPSLAGVQGELPERQPEQWPRERSIEHAELTPVFGTSCPPKGVSGAIRRYAYARYSEGRSAHWMLLILADRVDSKAQVLRSFATLRPDNPVTQTGVIAEVRHHGLRSRLGHGRTDIRHQVLDPVVVVGPWLLAGWSGYRVVRGLVRRVSS